MLPKSLVPEAQDIPTRGSKHPYPRLKTSLPEVQNHVLWSSGLELPMDKKIKNLCFCHRNKPLWSTMLLYINIFLVMYIQKFGYTYRFLNSKQYLFKHRAKHVIPKKCCATSNRWFGNAQSEPRVTSVECPRAYATTPSELHFRAAFGQP